MLFDQAEAGWLREMTLKNKFVLIHDALGDAEVTPIAAQIMARAYNCSTVSPESRHIFGVPEQEGPFSGSGVKLCKERLSSLLQRLWNGYTMIPLPHRKTISHHRAKTHTNVRDERKKPKIKLNSF